MFLQPSKIAGLHRQNSTQKMAEAHQPHFGTPLRKALPDSDRTRLRPLQLPGPSHSAQPIAPSDCLVSLAANAHGVTLFFNWGASLPEPA